MTTEVTGTGCTDELADFFESLNGMEGLSSTDIAELKGYLAAKVELDLPEVLQGAASILEQSTLESALQEEQPVTSAGPTDSEPKPAETNRDIRAAISLLNLPERVKLGMFGNNTCRSLLVNDPNRMVQLSVMNNPKLQEREVEGFVKNPNLSQQVLRVISERKRWMKSYTLKLGLVSNPKTPSDIALKWLRYLNKADLRRLARSKGVPQVIVINVRKRLADLEKKGEG